ncbi:MAG TPA: hypothetical protein V6C58_25695 [Allocoleopsis sp.]
MRQHSITLSLGLIAVALSSCAQDAPPPPAPTPNPASPSAKPSFDQPLVQPGKKDNKAEKPNDQNNLPAKTPENKTNITPGLLPPTNPDDRLGAKGRRDPFAIIPLRQTDIETPGGLKITIKPNQFLKSPFRNIPQLPPFPRLPNLNKSQNVPNVPLRSIPQLPIFPKLPNLNKSQNVPNVPPRSIPQLPTFPQLPNLNKSQNVPNEPARPIPQLPTFPQLPNLKPSGVKRSSILRPNTSTTATGIKNATNILFVANKPKTAGTTTKPKTAGTTTKPKTAGTTTKPKTAGTTTTTTKPKTAGTTTTTTKPNTSGSNEVTTKKPSTPSIAKPEQPLVLPPNQEIPVFKPELPPIPEPTIAQAVQVTGVIEIANIPYAFVKAPDEPSPRTVKVGQRLSNGQVLVKRIEVNQKTVVLEQNGIEVNQRLIEGTAKKQV